MFKFDKIDVRIIELLQQDGRMPASEIARRIGDISQRVVSYRIDRMVKEKMISVSAIPDPRAFGFRVMADVFVEVEPGEIKELAAALASYKQITYVSCSLGEKDISVQLVARNNDEIYDFATRVIGNLPGVRKTTTSIVPVKLKDVHQWRIPADAGKSEED
jgi:Lrp/AsnC family transcriptional regulator for asnA, asnC and gidA